MRREPGTRERERVRTVIVRVWRLADVVALAERAHIVRDGRRWHPDPTPQLAGCQGAVLEQRRVDGVLVRRETGIGHCREQQLPNALVRDKEVKEKRSSGARVRHVADATARAPSVPYHVRMAEDLAPLNAADAATAAGLRDRFGFLRDIVAEMERRVPYAAAMVRSRQGLRFELRDAEQDTGRLDPQDGIVLTASTGHGLEEASTDHLDPDSVRRLADELSERAASYRPMPGEPALEIAVPPGDDRDYATVAEIDPAGLPLADKLARFEELRRQLRARDQRAVQAVAQYAEQSLQQVVVNRSTFSTQQVRRVQLLMALVVSDGQQQRYGVIIRGATGGLEHLDIGPDDLAEGADSAVAMLGADPMPPAMYDVVTDTRTSGIIAHEAFGHGVETDMFLKERARAAHFVGKRVGSELVNIIDDPTLPGAYGSYFVDDEGLPSARTQIIRNGVFERGLTDLYSATRLGIDRSANGRRESVHRKAYARMSNTFFAPGESTRDELLASLDSGMLVGDSLSGMEDPKGWGMQISAQWAKEYRNGKPTGRIFSPVALTGYVPDVLANVTMVSRDFEMDPGTCGKGWKEMVPVSSGGPYLRTRCRLG